MSKKIILTFSQNWSGMGLLADNVDKVRGKSTCITNLSTAGWDMETLISLVGPDLAKYLFQLEL